MAETPKFIQGVYSFRGAGLERAVPLQPPALHKVPFDKRAQLVYLRAGNSSSELIYLSLKQSGKVIRLFPVGAKDAIHVPLAIVEDIDPESELELYLGATEGSSGSVVLDLGLVEL
ncbi:MAG: molybdopterin oxidoreductase [Polyangiaceae bacterium]